MKQTAKFMLAAFFLTFCILMAADGVAILIGAPLLMTIPAWIVLNMLNAGVYTFITGATFLIIDKLSNKWA